MPSKDPTSVEPKTVEGGRKPKAPASPTERPARTDLFALAIDAANGRIVTLERMDAAGARHDLSAKERARLAQASATVRQLVEQAFEAGIECILGEGGKREPTESEADGELSRMLLQSLIERSNAKHLIEDESLDRAIVGTLIGRAATSGSPAVH